VFLRITGETVHGYVRRTRLEHAANQLIFDPATPVIDIAQKCGFSSLSSFSRAFRETFNTSPGRWRRGESAQPPVAWRDNAEIADAYTRIGPLPLPDVQLEQLQPIPVAYVRHRGYNREIRRAWQKLEAWCELEKRQREVQIGLHHSNPAWVPLARCHYVACIGIDQPVLRRGPVNTLVIPGGLHARCRLQGRYGELLPWIDKVMTRWLPESGFRARTTPAFVRYHRNQFLDPDEGFDLDFHLPIGLG
jgi:AraC family transcriptional regulator